MAVPDGSVFAQAPAAPAPTGPAPTGLIVARATFSPIVSDLDAAVAFYRDGLGLDVQGTGQRRRQPGAAEHVRPA
jgi:hypothetical protein